MRSSSVLYQFEANFDKKKHNFKVFKNGKLLVTIIDIFIEWEPNPDDVGNESENCISVVLVSRMFARVVDTVYALGPVELTLVGSREKTQRLQETFRL